LELQLLIGTTNKGKYNEMAAVLDQLPITLLNPLQLGITDDVEETGTTYQENALIKAKFYALNSGGIPTLGEDSGLVVDALANELGVYTRRWGAGAKATDQEWLDFFMNRMQEFKSPEQRTAKFISHMCLLINNEPVHFYGETLGLITDSVEAPLYDGVPLSSVFKPKGFDIVYSAMTEDQKNQISHRGKAIAQVKNYLAEYYGL